MTSEHGDFHALHTDMSLPCILLPARDLLPVPAQRPLVAPLSEARASTPKAPLPKAAVLCGGRLLLKLARAEDE